MKSGCLRCYPYICIRPLCKQERSGLNPLLLPFSPYEKKKNEPSAEPSGKTPIDLFKENKKRCRSFHPAKQTASICHIWYSYSWKELQILCRSTHPSSVSGMSHAELLSPADPLLCQRRSAANLVTFCWVLCFLRLHTIGPPVSLCSSLHSM